MYEKREAKGEASNMAKQDEDKRMFAKMSIHVYTWFTVSRNIYAFPHSNKNINIFAIVFSKQERFEKMKEIFGGEYKKGDTHVTRC